MVQECLKEWCTGNGMWRKVQRAVTIKQPQQTSRKQNACTYSPRAADKPEVKVPQPNP